jgi:hypothetical protein
MLKVQFIFYVIILEHLTQNLLVLNMPFQVRNILWRFSQISLFFLNTKFNGSCLIVDLLPAYIRIEPLLLPYIFGVLCGDQR